MRELAERAYFGSCRTAGRLLRSARYSKVRVAGTEARKRRSFFAPLLIRLSVPLVRLLDGGVRVLPRRAWEERERELYERLYGASIRVEPDGTLVLPRLPGRTLATLLEGPDRKRAIELAVAALAEVHRRGVTHADAMAENVLVDLDGGAARWIDFETVHDERRSRSWRRADDLRALLATCLVRTAPEGLAETLRHVLDVYADDEVARELVPSFASAWRRPLTLHLLQAGLSFRAFREIDRRLRQSVT